MKDSTPLPFMDHRRPQTNFFPECTLFWRSPQAIIGWNKVGKIMSLDPLIRYHRFLNFFTFNSSAVLNHIGTWDIKKIQKYCSCLYHNVDILFIMTFVLILSFLNIALKLLSFLAFSDLRWAPHWLHPSPGPFPWQAEPASTALEARQAQEQSSCLDWSRERKAGISKHHNGKH